MNLLILNAGSSSLKYQIITMPEERSLARGMVSGIGQEKNYDAALKEIFSNLGTEIKIDAIGHRVVHGGEKYKSSVLVSAQVLEDIRSLFDLAPLHNPANLAGILACQKMYPNLPNVAVFDTAFNQSLPPKAYLYGLPYELYEKFGIRKYGFHGISHQYVSKEAMKILKENIVDFKILSCHLGAGASICAIAKGKSIENSMGFTPLEGLMMGTRAGSFDPEIILYLLKKGYKVEEVEEMIQKKAGLKGISQSTSNVQELREEELEGDKKSELAFQMFVYRIQRFIGSYTAALGGLDVLIFTGGIGEKAYYLRRSICEQFSYIGLKLNQQANRANENIISSGNSQVTVMVVPTNEELEIARECALLFKEKN